MRLPMSAMKSGPLSATNAPVCRLSALLSVCQCPSTPYHGTCIHGFCQRRTRLRSPCQSPHLPCHGCSPLQSGTQHLSHVPPKTCPALEITQHQMLSLAPSQRPPAPSCLRQICSHENSPSNHESMKKPRRSGPCKSTDRNCAPSRRNSQGFSGHNPLCSVIFFSSYPDCQVPSWECSDSDSTCCSAQETPSGAWDPA